MIHLFPPIYRINSFPTFYSNTIFYFRQHNQLFSLFSTAILQNLPFFRLSTVSAYFPLPPPPQYSTFLSLPRIINIIPLTPLLRTNLSSVNKNELCLLAPLQIHFSSSTFPTLSTFLPFPHCMNFSHHINLPPLK